MDSKNILLINFGGIGDEILFLPVVMSLKKEFPDSSITLVLEPRSAGVQYLTNKIDKYITVDIKKQNKYLELLKFIFKTWFHHYDIVISSGSNKFIPILLFLTGIKVKIGYDSGNLSKKLLTYPIKLNKNQYAVSMYHDLVMPLTENKTELPVIDVVAKEKIPNSVLIHPGVSKISIRKGIIKTIQPETWAEIIRKLALEGKRVLLTGGPDDFDCIEEILRFCKGVEFENLYGKTKTLKELAELISSAEKFVCSDSAPLHIAVALGVKTYAIFGPTDDKKLVPDSIIKLKADDNCPLRPCLWEKRQTSCKNPVCLKFNSDKIVAKIL